MPHKVPPSVTPRHAILLLLTVLSTTWVGVEHYHWFLVGFSGRTVTLTAFEQLLSGLTYSVPIILILGAHELGHFFACRYYGVDASAPYFLPMPFFLIGTLGAFIRIRQPIAFKRALFDIGIAGPIAGFLVAVPALLLGMSLSRLEQLPEQFSGVVLELGEPLLFKAAAWLTFGTLPEGYTISMHPVAFAAWFGLIATALNLFPIAQLDGGHISYAVLGRRSTTVTFVAIACLLAMTALSLSWLAWTVLMIGMLLAFGPRHPRTIDEEVPLDPARKWLAVFAVVMFVVCFTPAPIELRDLVLTR
jgi:membrane-associated protease RseP (regulator of RpoE activity)